MAIAYKYLLEAASGWMALAPSVPCYPTTSTTFY